jgi:hypothetical protein
VRTTDLAERSFEEGRRRAKVIPGLWGERAAIKLVFATMMSARKRWGRVPVKELERCQLELLCAPRPRLPTSWLQERAPKQATTKGSGMTRATFVYRNVLT